jgi:hypothetical protein
VSRKSPLLFEQQSQLLCYRLQYGIEPFESESELPLFDALFQNNHPGDANDDPGGNQQQPTKYRYKSENLIKIRVTFSRAARQSGQHDHVMGDTALSTNDMITAFGWLLERSLSGEDAYNISMVVYVRGRCGVDAFADTDNVNERNGLFGDGITNVVAAHPPTPGFIGILDIATAEIATRAALVAGLLAVPDRIAESKRRTPISSHELIVVIFNHILRGIRIPEDSVLRGGIVWLS